MANDPAQAEAEVDAVALAIAGAEYPDGFVPKTWEELATTMAQVQARAAILALDHVRAKQTATERDELEQEVADKAKTAKIEGRREAFKEAWDRAHAARTSADFLEWLNRAE